MQQRQGAGGDGAWAAPPPHHDAPQGVEALVSDGAREAVADALVGGGQAALLHHLILVLDEQLHALNGRGGGLGDRGSDAAHEEVDLHTRGDAVGVGWVGWERVG